MKFDQIIFDFDGVILDSHRVKTEAFYQIFKKYGKKIAIKSKNYHIKNSGISRYIKFRYIFKNFIKKDFEEKEIKKLSHEFKKICEKKIKKLKVAKSLLKFFRKNVKNYNFFISTGTPQKEIENILKKKNINKYFTKIYGSPENKITHIKKIRNKKLNCLFIGDSFEDYKSCKKTNTNFLLKEHSENKKLFKKIKIKRIINYLKFEETLNKY